MIVLAILLTAAGTLAVSHFAGPVWRWLNARRPRLLDQLRAIETEAEKIAQPIVQQAETEYKTVRDDLQQKFAAVGAKLTEWKARATTAEQSAADLKAQLDAANAHIAELTAQDAEVESAVAALADQAGQ